MTSFIIVESPAKAKKIQSILGENVRAKASMGHIRDLPEKELGVDVSNEFAPHYQIISNKRQLVRELQDMARESSRVYLATDEDREGEAISWHLAHELKLPIRSTPRMVFHEITPAAIRHSFDTPRTLHMPSVDSQQTRRILDRLVGYQVSPLLCRALNQSKLSAGRVQSAALRILVDRERDHEQFQSSLHVSILGQLKASSGDYPTLKVQWKPNQEAMTDELVSLMGKWANMGSKSWVLEKTPEAKIEKENPPAPFTTSTLAQEASKRLHYNAKMTAQLSQGLYEAGWITYHRTDSVALSDDAKQAIRDWVIGNLGEEKMKQRVYANKQKNAQEAHECIRPVQFDRVPGYCEVPGTPEAARLYALIWCRTIATQVIAAEYKRVVATWSSPTQELEGFWEWASRELVREGYLEVWRRYFGSTQNDSENSVDADNEANQEDAKNWWERENLVREWGLVGLRLEERAQEPPGRYRESSFIKVLEQRGIGRPSTYATIVGTLTDRKYIQPKTNTPGVPIDCRWQVFLPSNEVKRGKKVVKVGAERGVWVVSPLGRQVCEYLEEKFVHLIEDQFTATMEHWLDEIANERTTMRDVLRVFWDKLSPLLEEAKRVIIPRDMVRNVIDLGEHPDLKSQVLVKTGKFGPYVECGSLKVNLPNTRELAAWTLDDVISENLFPVILGEKDGFRVSWRRGKFGSYLHWEKDGGKNITWKDKEQESPPSWEEVESFMGEGVSQVEKKCRELSKTIVAQTTRYGWALRKGTQWAKPPPGTTLETITLAEAKAAFENLSKKGK